MIHKCIAFILLTALFSLSLAFPWKNSPIDTSAQHIAEYWNANLQKTTQTPSFVSQKPKSIQDLSKEQIDKIEDFIANLMQCLEISGLSIGITNKDGTLFYNKGFGERGKTSGGQVDENTVFSVGSVTKSFTGFLIAKLAEEGKLDINAPVNQYLGGFALDNLINSAMVSPADLVTHHTGYPAFSYDAITYGYKDTIPPSFLVNNLKYVSSQTSPRQEFMYNNIMFTVAGFLASYIRSQENQDQADLDWHDMVEKEIFQVLGMDRSISNVSALSSFTDNFAYPHLGEQGQMPLDANKMILSTAPAGSICSTSKDLLKWVQLFLNKGTSAGQRVVSEGTIDLITSPHVATKLDMLQTKLTKPDGKIAVINKIQSYGFGLFNGVYDGIRILSHAGTVVGSVAELTLLPDYGFGIVSMCNEEGMNQALQLLHYFIIDLLTEQNVPSLVNKEMVCMSKPPKPGPLPNFDVQDPSRELSDYVGDYIHPFMGQVSISISDNQKMVLSYGISKGLLYSLGNDRFLMSNQTFQILDDFEASLGPSLLPVEFQVNLFTGKVDSLLLPLQPGVGPIRFTLSGVYNDISTKWTSKDVHQPFTTRTVQQINTGISGGVFAGVLVGTMVFTIMATLAVGAISILVWHKMRANPNPKVGNYIDMETLEN